MKEVTDELEKVHIDDLDFELPENLEEQVDAALKRQEAIQLLTHQKESPKTPT